MGWFKKKADPISDRARALNEKIAALEAQIKELDSRLDAPGPSAPRLRSTAVPQGANSPLHSPPPEPQPQPQPAAPREPIFEEVDQTRLKAREEVVPHEHYNELGLRKYDLAALFRRVQNHFRGPSTANPKLVSYLAAGSIQGLRPMRYERRVARNRFLIVTFGLLALLVGILAIIRWHR